MRIILLGAPGSGKGTQCKRIVSRYGVAHLSSGDILRSERAAGTALGKKAQGYMDAGALVPDELIVEMMAGAMSRSSDNGFVLDGFPRTIKQAEELDKFLGSSGQKIGVVLNLKISDEVVGRRMTGRRSCPKCGAVYHIENLKPKIDGICDNDGTKLIQRTDDTPEVVASRLKTYHNQTEPVIAYYKKQYKNTVCEVEADRDADEVSEKVFRKLDGLVQKCGKC